MYAELDESLMTGNALIDGQHQQLVDKINELLECCEEGNGRLEAIKMLDYLMDYTEFHFNAEEELQRKINYPAFNEHKAKHEEFKKTVAELHQMLEESEGPTDEFVEAVKENVVNWLYRHIKAFDCSIAVYMNMNHISEIL